MGIMIFLTNNVKPNLRSPKIFFSVLFWLIILWSKTYLATLFCNLFELEVLIRRTFFVISHDSSSTVYNFNYLTFLYKFYFYYIL